MNEKVKFNLSVTILLIIGLGYTLAFNNIVNANENIDSETSAIASDESKEKEVVEQNSKEQIGKNKTFNEGKEKYFGRYKYIRDEGLARDWEDRLDKGIIVTLRIWVDPSGNVAKSEIAKSCGNSELDQLVLDSIKKRFFKPSNDGQTTIGIIEFFLGGPSFLNEINKDSEESYQFVKNYSVRVVVGGVVGLSHKTYKTGDIVKGKETPDGIVVRIAPHSIRNERGPGPWSYQEFLTIPKEYLINY